MAKNKKKSTRRSAPRGADAITRDNQLNSPLLRLPGEIRNRIYEYVFSGSEMKVKDPYWGYPDRAKKNTPVYVLATCQQIQHEASSIFWNACIIDAHLADRIVDVEVVMGPSKCARITSLVVDENVALELSHPNPTPEISYMLQKLPMLRKVYVQSFFGIHTGEVVVDRLRGVSARDLEVECRDPT